MYEKLKASHQRNLNTCGLQMYSSDLLIPSTWKSGGFEKRPEKLGDWDLKQGDFQNMHQIKKKKQQQNICSSVFFTFLVPPVVFFCCLFCSRILDNEEPF